MERTVCTKLTDAYKRHEFPTKMFAVKRTESRAMDQRSFGVEILACIVAEIHQDEYTAVNAIWMADKVAGYGKLQNEKNALFLYQQRHSTQPALAENHKIHT